MNITSIIASFYAGTGGLDIGLVNPAQGIECGENWEMKFHRYSPIGCKSMLKVVNNVLGEALKEEITLTITEKLEGKYSASEIISLT